jgi:hypothetical protein
VVAAVNAAVLDRPEPQLGLEGIPEPVVSAVQPVRIAIAGLLDRRAEVRISTDGLAHLVVQVMQPKSGLPFVAIWHAKDSRAAGDLHLFAQHMVAGLPVTLIGVGLVLGQCDRDQDALLLQRCDAVQVHGIAAFTHLTQDPNAE